LQDYKIRRKLASLHQLLSKTIKMDVSEILEQSAAKQSVLSSLPFALSSWRDWILNFFFPFIFNPFHHSYHLTRQAIAVQKELAVEFDLGLLACFDPNPIDQESYQ